MTIGREATDPTRHSYGQQQEKERMTQAGSVGGKSREAGVGADRVREGLRRAASKIG